MQYTAVQSSELDPPYSYNRSISIDLGLSSADRRVCCGRSKPSPARSGRAHCRRSAPGAPGSGSRLRRAPSMEAEEEGATSDDDTEQSVVLCYTGGLRDGLTHGRGTQTFTSGATFRGRFDRGLKCGRGVTEHPDGSKQTGQYVNDKLEGRGVYDFPGGESLAFTFASGTMHGPFEVSTQVRTTKQPTTTCLPEVLRESD